MTVCQACGVIESPLWRKGPSGKRTLCNSCGIKWNSGQLRLARSNSPFPFTDEELEVSPVEDIGSWRLGVQIRQLKSQVRDMEKIDKKLMKLYQCMRFEDRNIDRQFRKVCKAAKGHEQSSSLQVDPFLDDTGVVLVDKAKNAFETDIIAKFEEKAAL